MPSSFVRTLRPVAIASSVAVLTLSSGCTTISNFLSGDKVDYKASGSQSAKLEVPPDLTQLTGQARYSQVGSSISAGAAATSATPGTSSVPMASVAPSAGDGVRLTRDGQFRWLAVHQSPEVVYEQAKAFWQDAGFTLDVDRPEAGVLETDWHETSAKINHDDGIRGIVGRVVDILYDSGLRDQYRTRIERTPEGCEVYISHRGMQEVDLDSDHSRTTWRDRPNDPGLEAEMLSRLMVRLSGQADAAQAKAAATTAPASASAASTPEPTVVAHSNTAKLDATGTVISLKADNDLTWRRVGLALDRNGFTIEGRDRQAGTYEVRLSVDDPSAAKPGFFGRLFGSSSDAETLARYKVRVQAQGEGSTVSVLTDEGQPSQSSTAKLITQRLYEELR